MKQLEFEDTGTHFEWNGSFSSAPPVKVPEKLCHSLQPEVKVEESDIKYLFSKSLVFDLSQYIGVTVETMMRSSTSASASNSKSSKSSRTMKLF